MSNRKLLANLGDADPITYGGLFAYAGDADGALPTVERLEPPDDSIDLDDDNARWTLRSTTLDRCTYRNGVLSANPFHPETPAWFADDLENIASFVSSTPEDLAESLCSTDPVELALAWQAVYDFHGWENADSYPLTLTRAEVEERYPELA